MQQLGRGADGWSTRAPVGEGVQHGVPLPPAQYREVALPVAGEHLDPVVRGAPGTAQHAYLVPGGEPGGHHVEAEEPTAAEHEQPHRAPSSTSATSAASSAANGSASPASALRMASTPPNWKPSWVV